MAKKIAKIFLDDEEQQQAESLAQLTAGVSSTEVEEWFGQLPARGWWYMNDYRFFYDQLLALKKAGDIEAMKRISAGLLQAKASSPK